MAHRVRAVIGAALLALVAATAASADPNVIPIAGGASGSALGDGGDATGATLLQPQSVAVLHDYDFYYRDYVIADYNHCLVRRVSNNDANFDSDVGTIATAVGIAGTCDDGGVATNSNPTAFALDHPTGVSATPERQVLIADSRSGRVHRWSPGAINGQTANTVTTLAGTKVDVGLGAHCAIAADGSDAINAQFCELRRVAAHPWNFDIPSGGDKRFLVADGGCGANQGLCDATAIAPRIYMVRLVAGVWKIQTAAIGCGGAGAKTVCFSNPTGIAFTGANTGEFLLTDATKNQVQRYDADASNVAEVVAGTGQPTAGDGSNIGDGGPPTSATFVQPSDVSMTGDGGYYIADTYNCSIRKVTDLTPQAEIFSIGGSCDDKPADATLPSFQQELWPAGLTLGSAGLYVADATTNQIKLFDRTTITLRPPTITTDGRPTFKVEALEGYGHFACAWDSVAEHVCQKADGGSLEADNTPFQIPALTDPPLGEGSHSFRACVSDSATCSIDVSSNLPVDPTPAKATFTIDTTTPPAATFTIAPNPVLVGKPVGFDGSASSSIRGAIARYEWDLDGDGSFETDTKAVAQATKTYASPGPVTVQLRVTDSAGLTNVKSGVVAVNAESFSGQLGVTINNGAQYTNKPAVTLTVAGPPLLTRLLVANDGGFLTATTFTPAKQIAWRLDSSGPERLPKTVYVRFQQGALTSPNYTDDIILDERPPIVDSATVAVPARAASAARLRTWKLRVKAHDTNSGVRGVQVAVKKKKPGKLIPYKKKLKVKLASRPKFIRAMDKAGNYSRWKKLAKRR